MCRESNFPAVAPVPGDILADDIAAAEAHDDLDPGMHVISKRVKRLAKLRREVAGDKRTSPLASAPLPAMTVSERKDAQAQRKRDHSVWYHKGAKEARNRGLAAEEVKKYAREYAAKHLPALKRGRR